MRTLDDERNIDPTFVNRSLGPMFSKGQFRSSAGRSIVSEQDDGGVVENPRRDTLEKSSEFGVDRLDHGRVTGRVAGVARQVLGVKRCRRIMKGTVGSVKSKPNTPRIFAKSLNRLNGLVRFVRRGIHRVIRSR